jgi:hypothetical protein
MGQRFAVLVVASVVGLTLPPSASAQSDGERTSRKALAFFEGRSDETIDAFLMRLRAAPLDEASRAKVVGLNYAFRLDGAQAVPEPLLSRSLRAAWRDSSRTVARVGSTKADSNRRPRSVQFEMTVPARQRHCSVLRPIGKATLHWLLATLYPTWHLALGTVVHSPRAPRP